ncbi:Tll0287-like domain-containing protein [Caldichromatium japonicum]|nr:DUF3365 domain-containing protein [Caldichromatium japonicum]
MPALASADDPLIEEAKALIKEFAGQLQSELKSAIQANGPVQAIAVCKERAPAIAAELSESSGWEIGRTSLKVRNAALNSPDDWEIQVLQSFEERKAAGEPVEQLSFAEIIQGEDGGVFRLMKAIPTQDLCLACHGDHVSEPVLKALAEYYPQDQARGFKAGDIRGAFSLAKPLAE